MEKDEKDVFVLIETSNNGQSTSIDTEVYENEKLARKAFEREVEDFDNSDMSLRCKVECNMKEMIFKATSGINFNISFYVQKRKLRKNSKSREEEEIA